MNKILLFFLVCWIFPVANYASPTIILADQQPGYSVKFDILEDTLGTLTLADFTQNSTAQRFAPIQDLSVSYGFTHSVYWVRFRVNHQARQIPQWFLQLYFPNMQHLDFCVPQNNNAKYTCKRTGTYYPFSTREIAYPKFTFKLPLSLGETKTFYMRFQTESSMNIGLRLSSPDEFALISRENSFIWGAFYAYILLVCFHNLFLWLSLKESNYLYYCLFNLTIGAARFSQIGLGSQYLWPDNPEFNYYAVPAIWGIGIILGINFGISFLQIKKQSILLYRIAQLEKYI
jgi:hypothetical protein